MNDRNWIVCFGSKYESPSVYTEKQLIKRFYQDGFKIFWVNPIPHKNLQIRNVSKDKSIFKKIFFRLLNQLKYFTKIDRNFLKLNPFFFPDVENTSEINDKLLSIQIMFFIKVLNIKNYSIISSGLTDITTIFPKKNYKYYIQISGDLYSDLRDLKESIKKNIIEKENRTFNSANLILAASKNIFSKIQSRVIDKEKVIYFPHGVEFEHFYESSCMQLKGIRKPIAGYFGSLTENNDQRMYLALADAGYSVVLIGKVTGDYSSCNHNNIHFLGAVNYKDLPSYAKNFDVCIMAWKPAEWIQNSNPSKTLEYFALGKPVVSVTIPELKIRFSDLMYFADTPEDFVKQTNKGLKENNDDLVRRRIEVAKNESWDNRYQSVLKLLSEKN